MEKPNGTQEQTIPKEGEPNSLVVGLVVGVLLISTFLAVGGGWGSGAPGPSRQALCRAAAKLKQTLYFTPGSSVSLAVARNPLNINQEITAISQNSRDPRVAGAFYQVLTTISGMTGDPVFNKKAWERNFANDPMAVYAADQLSQAFTAAKSELRACGAESPANWKINLSE